MALSNSPDSLELRKIADDTTEMLLLMWEEKFHEVVVFAEEFLISRPDDKAVKYILERAKRYIMLPPEPNWDGVNRMQEK